jgi:F-type H+-transporting ATPase subunit gamma
MASLRAIRSRIKSVRGTQKITKAMKLVAAAKLRRAQDAVTRARPYAELIEEMLGALATESEGHPLLARRPMKRVEVVVLTSDRGLAGGFNSNVVRRLQSFLVDAQGTYDRVGVSTIGRRGRDFAKRRGVDVRKHYDGMLGHLDYKHARSIAEDLIELYSNENLDGVFLLYNQFKSALVQKVTLTQLLPIVPHQHVGGAGGKAEGGYQLAEFLFEPSRREVLDELLPKHLGMQVWRALLESEASEHGARMTAMESATKNAKEMIARLTLQYNRARQASITKELMEIVSGAEALK